MAILKKVEPRGDHRCDKPSDPQKRYGRGTIWECDECGNQFRLESDQREGWIWVEMAPENYLPSQRS